MGVADVTAGGVQAAIAECRRLGRAAFLERYRFGRSREYVVVVDGEEYDSKAVIGAAHGYDRPDLGPLSAKDFSGGAAGAAGHLERLGFEVRQHSVSERNPPWAAEELVLALDLYLRFGLLDATSPEVVATSEALNNLTIHDDRPDAARFRNPNGVAMKLANFASLDPDHAGAGLSRHGQRDREIWERFNGDADAVASATAAILDGIAWDERGTSGDPKEVVRLPAQRVLTARFIVGSGSGFTGERREAQLVLRYQNHLIEQGHETSRHRYPGGYECDLFDETVDVLYEAKANTLRESIRLAVGQLLDYRRFEDSDAVQLSVLLPRRPADDSLAYLRAVGIAAVWETSNGFTAGPKLALHHKRRT